MCTLPPKSCLGGLSYRFGDIDRLIIFRYTTVMNQSMMLLNKLHVVERELQELKITVYNIFPKGFHSPSRYADQALLKASKVAREDIWQEKYAKKVKVVS